MSELNKLAFGINSLASNSRLDWAFLYGKPALTGVLKRECSDFVVIEDLGFELTGEGEHVFVLIEKTDCNTLFVAEKLAKFAGLSAKLVSYAGLKDRKAVTKQWFSLHIPGNKKPDFSNFYLDGCHILNVTRHNKKLKIGALKGNKFIIKLYDVTHKRRAEEKLSAIQHHGVPNYFGEQRFGHNNQNIIQALRWAIGEISVKDRNKRRFYLSAARSAMFNCIVSERIKHKLYNQVIEGDVLQLAQRGSWFVAEKQDLSLLQQRVLQKEINITAPMIGDSVFSTQSAALEFEKNIADDWVEFCQLLKQERVGTARRSVCLYPQSLCWQWHSNDMLELSFYLPAGCYATSVIRELLIVEDEGIITT